MHKNSEKKTVVFRFPGAAGMNHLAKFLFMRSKLDLLEHRVTRDTGAPQNGETEQLELLVIEALDFDHVALSR